MEIPLSWAGPFVFVPQTGFACVFDRPEISNPGLYLWTVEYEGGYLVNYVGETGLALQARLLENVAWSFAGREGAVSDPEQFRQGRAVRLAKFNIFEFLADYPRLSAAIYEVYRSYRVFIVSPQIEASVRKYIEAGIIRALRSSGGQVAAFLCNSRLIRRSPEPLSARFVGGQRFHGIGEVVDC